MSNNTCLAMFLDGPMQSWGFASRFTRRSTALFPTKSGVIGLLAAALGVDKLQPDEAETVARLAALRCTVITLPRKHRNATLPILRLNDFHTIGGGYDPDSQWQSMPRSADNKTLKNPVVSTRHYLLDARFGVLLEGEEALLQQIADALRNPKWGVWLGRKCCLPASPLLVTVAAGRECSWRELLRRAGCSPELPIESFDRVEEAGDEAGTETLNDQPVTFATPNAHAPRRIRVTLKSSIVNHQS